MEDEQPDLVIDRVFSADRSTAVLTLRGTLDITSAAGFRHAFKTVEAATVEVRLGELEFLDSSGLAALLFTRRLAEERDQEVHYRGAGGEVRELLERTGTLAIIEG